MKDTVKNLLRMPDSQNSALLQVNIQLPDSNNMNWIIQLLNDNGEVFISKEIDSSQSINWPYLPGGNYHLRAVKDMNNNGRFDGGDPLTGREPEKVVYYPQPLLLKPNWEMADVMFHVE
jgi:hypothetical protein